MHSMENVKLSRLRDKVLCLCLVYVKMEYVKHIGI